VKAIINPLVALKIVGDVDSNQKAYRRQQLSDSIPANSETLITPAYCCVCAGEWPKHPIGLDEKTRAHRQAR
jgi:hypothetical protein